VRPVVATAEIVLCGFYCRICFWPVVATAEIVCGLWLLMQNLCEACICYCRNYVVMWLLLQNLCEAFSCYCRNCVCSVVTNAEFVCGL